MFKIIIYAFIETVDEVIINSELNINKRKRLLLKYSEIKKKKIIR